MPVAAGLFSCVQRQPLAAKHHVHCPLPRMRHSRRLPARASWRCLRSFSMGRSQAKRPRMCPSKLVACTQSGPISLMRRRPRFVQELLSYPDSMPLLPSCSAAPVGIASAPTFISQHACQEPCCAVGRAAGQMSHLAHPALSRESGAAWQSHDDSVSAHTIGPCPPPLSLFVDILSRRTTTACCPYRGHACT